MVDRNASFRQHFLKVAIADRIATIPAHLPQYHITLEMAPLEIRHRSVRPISAKHAQASRFLQQSRSEHPARVAQDAQLQREAKTIVGAPALADMPEILIAEGIVPQQKIGRASCRERGCR